MTSLNRKSLKVRWRWPRAGRRPVAIAGLGALLLVGGVLPMRGDIAALAAGGSAEGQEVPPELAEAIVAASLSCPALTPSRLAAQIMAASRFSSDATRGIAGLTDDGWKSWHPAAEANRDDSEANVQALAHLTCDLVGQLRTAGLTGDLWQFAVAASKVGIDDVLAARAVPDSARSYVDLVQKYAAWYADQDPFRVDAGGGAAEPSMAEAVPVPDAYVASIVKAGRICSVVTADRIAAQLMAMSRFDPNLRSTDGAEGIAQFSPALWRQYKVSDSASVWNPQDAIPALGMAMCDLEAQLGRLTGADSYRLALAAYQWGEATVRAANGVPRANLPQLSDATLRYLPTYEKDTRLTGGTSSPSPSSSPTGVPTTGTPTTGVPTTSSPTTVPETTTPAATGTATTQAPATQTPATQAPTTKAPTTQAPTTIAGFEIGKNYKLLNYWTGAVAELPDKDANTTVGAHVQLWEKRDQKDQYWRLTAAPEAGYVVFVNAYSGHAMGIESGGTWDGAKVLQVKLNPTDRFQQWKLEHIGGGWMHLRNHATGKVLDILGTDRGAESDGTWNGHWVEQWAQVDAERDQRWSLVR
ncbi:RICIN domain-containing protein [Actinoplanes sp. NBRC 101535]|uniref:RICIN domain-containing protein n=1 Tax=Actinoplanes sp. NBRC 101535 TaxID=3032196 RepID=UPI0024A52944|nr:RICIN domain-containing protein [Actinoplanes sp. NBRC 101535]GLY02439.1 hypothetical protein Acsp01_28180 [Actinoplanes sp. NBRC 101535]